MSSLQAGRRYGTLALPPPPPPVFELSEMREVAFDALVQRTLHPPRILRNPVSGGESPGLSSTASPQASSLVFLALLGNCPRLLLLLASLARRGRITRISAVSSSLGGSSRSGGRRNSQSRSQPDGTTLQMRMLSWLPPLWRQCLVMGQSWVVAVLRDDYCVPFKGSPPSRSHTPVAFTTSQGRLSSGSVLAPRGRGEACQRNLGNHPRSGSWLYSRLFLVE